jgi:DNA-binding response OmpR family regulator
MARVLVAEDDEDVLFLLEMVLEDAGFTVAATRSVAAALRVLAGGNVDCVLTDLGLPGESGTVLAAAASGAGIPVVVATGSLPEGAPIEAAGWRLLHKPFRMEELVATLTAALAAPPAAPAPRIAAFLAAMAERCRDLADRAEAAPLALDLTLLAEEMRGRANGAA